MGGLVVVAADGRFVQGGSALVVEYPDASKFSTFNRAWGAAQRAALRFQQPMRIFAHYGSSVEEEVGSVGVVKRCDAMVDGGRCAGLVGHTGRHYAHARERDCVCPFPRLSCPSCSHRDSCAACRAAAPKEVR